MVVLNDRITIVTAAESMDLTVKATVKDRLGITVATFDSTIDSIIIGASEAIRRYTGARFAGQEITELTEGRSSELLRLNDYPVLSVSEIKLDDVVVDEADYTGQRFDQGFVFQKDKWDDTRGEYLYAIRYIYGYNLPSFTSNPLSVPDLPPSIEEAAILTVKNFFLSRDRDSTIKKESVPDVYSVTFGGSGNVANVDTLITADIQNLLEPFRRYKI